MTEPCNMKHVTCNVKSGSFTLLEVLVTVTIIGLLIGVVSVSFSQFTKQAKDARRKADLEQIRMALEMYRGNPNLTTYPTPCCGVTGLPFGSGQLTGDGSTYLENIPQDPLANRNYSYYYLGDSVSYTLGTRLEISSGPSCAGNPPCGSGNCSYCLGPYGQK